MQFRHILAFAALFILVWLIGCSSEEPSTPAKGSEVVRGTIETPPNPVPADLVAEEQEKPVADVSKSLVSEETIPPEEAPEDGGRDLLVELTDLETPSGIIPETKDGHADSGPGPGEGEYIVLQGDSLAVIAGREDVFGDPLKWAVLYQLNRDRLEELILDERLPERPVPEGTRLRYRLTEEETKRVEPASDRTWVVNVVSSLTADRIDGPAVRLLEKGYPVYISRAIVDGQKWMRLRVGFFNDRESAVKAGNQLQEVLQQDDSWPVRIGPEETSEYADLLRPLYEG